MPPSFLAAQAKTETRFMAWVRADKPVNPKKDHCFLGLRSDRHLPRGPIGPWGDVVDDVFHRTLPENTVNITMMTVTTSMLVRCLPCLSRCFLVPNIQLI